MPVEARGARGRSQALRAPPRPLTTLLLLCSDGEAPGGNPMVAGFQDDVDLEDKTPIRPLLPIGPVPGENLTHSSADVAGHPKATILAPQKCPQPETKWYVEGTLGETVGVAAGPATSSSLSQRSSTKASRPHRGTAPRTAEGSSQGHEDRKEELAASSESDPEGPIAAQMLSFVMDDPDFESDSDTPRRVVRIPKDMPGAGREEDRRLRMLANIMVTRPQGQACPPSMVAAAWRGCGIGAATLSPCHGPDPGSGVGPLAGACYLPGK